MPAKTRSYLKALAELTGAKLAIASVGPGRERPDTAAAGAGNHRVAQLLRGSRHDGLRGQALLHEDVLAGRHAPESVAHGGSLFGDARRDFAQAPQYGARDSDGAVAAFDVPLLGRGGAKIRDIRLALGDFEPHDIGTRVLDLGKAGQVDEHVETKAFQRMQGGTVGQCDHACLEYTAAS